jgi:adhesin HecA-like repeat protein
LTAEQDVILKSGVASMLSKWAGQTGTQSSLASKTGTVSVTATDALLMSGATIDGAAGLNVAAGRVSASTLRSADGNAVYKSSLQSSAGSIALSAGAAISLLGSDLFAANDIVAQSAGFASLNDGAIRSTVVALGGGVLIGSIGDINNVGSLIQGNARIAGNAASLGAITLTAAGGILNESPSETMLAAIFGVGDDVSLQASADVINHHARIISNQSLTIAAGGDVRNIIDKQAGANGEQGVAYQATETRWLLLSQSNSGFDIDYGRVAMPNQLAYLVAESGMTIQAANFLNRGGIVLVNNGGMAITAGNTFRNEAVFDGQAHYQRSCLIFCSSSASSDVSSHGGVMSASADIVIQAGAEAVNSGGDVFALGDLTVTAPRVYAQGVAGYRAYNTADFKSWFGSAWGRLYATDTGGGWLSARKLTLNGQGVIDGGSFTGMTELVANSGILTIRAPQRDPMSIERNIGFGSALW